MGTDLKSIDPALLALMHGSFGKDGALKPFAKEIFLLECHVAGTSHQPVKEIEPGLSPGALLPFLREPANKFDTLAIRIHDEAGHTLGWVPKEKNEVLARLMDAGKLLFGRLEGKSWVGGWLKLDVRVFLRDL
jgi:hypothetical protein